MASISIRLVRQLDILKDNYVTESLASSTLQRSPAKSLQLGRYQPLISTTSTTHNSDMYMVLGCAVALARS